MRISVIIPTLDRPDLLMEACDSVLSQAYADWELIIVDDGSLVPVSLCRMEPARDEQITLIRHERRKGIAAARNSGAAAATGDVLLFLDDDDRLSPDTLLLVSDVFCTYRDIDCLFMNVEPFGERASESRAAQARSLDFVLQKAGSQVSEHLFRLEQDALFAALLKSVPIAFQRVAVTRRYWSCSGGYCEALEFPEPQWALWLAINGTAVICTKPCFGWRVDGQNFFSQPGKALDLSRCLIESDKLLGTRLIHAGLMSEPLSAALRKSTATHHINLAFQLQQRGEWKLGFRDALRALTLCQSWASVRMVLSFLVPTNWKSAKAP